MKGLDVRKARLSRKNLFPPMQVKGSLPLRDVVRSGRMHRKDELLVVERNGVPLAFSVYQMAYHHIAQGELAGHPYLVAY
ncbi:hypothetical protein GCM10011571_05820 [Marinithermofilum abyssi]|uniref:Uncharacterized protein n=1 Tax=Marinithermofilum abyssi TaxID=1571185 RepID=A0A8J2VCH5_9BACL|nr:DUF3179 domain-containing (seleno)protein [Marinithermofilum abyssi]GGE07404.1 hypothetical protein GCM10011571_05820 [Marinithermofilum abyssi]